MDLLSLVKEQGVVNIINDYVKDLERADKHEVLMAELRATVKHTWFSIDGYKSPKSTLERGEEYCKLVFVNSQFGLKCFYAVKIDDREVFYHNNKWSVLSRRKQDRLDFWDNEYLTNNN